MSKLKTYYSDTQNWESLINGKEFMSYVSKDPMFWISRHGNDKTVMLYVNGDDDDHTMMSKQIGIKITDIEDIRTVVDQPKAVIDITKTINTTSKLVSTDFDKTVTVRDVLTKVMQELNPKEKTLSFDNSPKKTGTFTDNFTGTDDDLLEDRTGWTLGYDGLNIAEIDSNGLAFNTGGGGTSFSYWYCTDQGDADQYIEVTDVLFNNENQTVYAAIRVNSRENFIGYRLVGTGAAGARLVTVIAATVSDLITTQGGSGYKYKIECEGTTIRFYVDTGSGFSQVGTDQTVTDFQTETAAGVIAKDDTGGVKKFDDFENGTFGSGSTILPIKINQQKRIYTPGVYRDSVRALPNTRFMAIEYTAPEESDFQSAWAINSNIILQPGVMQ